MYKLVLLKMFLLFSVGISAQTNQYEQKAVDYFFDNIFHENYKNENKIEFNEYTEDTKADFNLYKNCFENERGLPLKLREKSFGKTFEKKPISLAKIKSISFKEIRMKSSKRLKIKVSLANELGNSFYVLIEIIKQYSFTDAYMLELGKNGEVLKWCKTGLLH